MNGSGDRVAKFDFGIVDAVAAQNHAACFVDFLGAAFEDLFQSLNIARAGPRENRQRGKRTPSHGVNVAQGIGGRDGSKGIRIVDDGSEKIDRLYNRQVWADAVDAGIVGGIESD